MPPIDGDVRKPSRVVLGLAGAVDYEITWDAATLEALVVDHAICPEELSQVRSIETERDLVAAILAFVADGAGGERFIGSSALVERFAARFAKRVTLGGTNLRAAAVLSSFGLCPLVHLVAIDDEVRRMLPDGVSYICSASADSSHPHLIVQYPRDARIRAGTVDVRAPRANRLIFVNDPPARELVLSDQLGSALSDAALFLISGFNVVQDPNIADLRLADLRRHMRRLPSPALVFFEDAGYHAPELSSRVRATLLPLIDIYSMSEDELRGHLGRTVDLLDPAAVAVALGEVRSLIPAPTLVVHTRYWALALGRDASSLTPMLAAGVTAATARYLHGDLLTGADYTTARDLPANANGAAVATAIHARTTNVACVAAKQVDDIEQPITVGLGDAFVGGFLAALAATRLAGKPAADIGCTDFT